jgi:mannose-6-phosphate isomerase
MQTETARTEDLLMIDASRNIPLTETLLYPLRFEPIYQYRPWGGRRLAHLLTEPLPSGLIGEAWLLGDRDDHAS